jgi:hypothetical protein
VRVDTGSNHRRNLSGIGRAPISKLTLQYGAASDFEAIAEIRSLKVLELSASPHPPFDRWRGVPLETLSLTNGKFKRLVDTAQLARLDKMTVIACRALEAFAGDNGSLKWLTVQGSPRLDVPTVTTFRNLEYLFVVGRQNEFALTDLGGMRRLRELWLDQCRVHVEATDLSGTLPAIEKLHIGGLAEEQALLLSQGNGSVTVSTGSATYIGGRRGGSGL